MAPCKRKAKKRRKNNAAAITQPIAAGGFWEVERVLSRRTIPPVQSSINSSNGAKGSVGVTEFLVQWKGDYDNTWEPEDNLCDSMLKEAYRVTDDTAEALLLRAGSTDEEKSIDGSEQQELDESGCVEEIGVPDIDADDQDVDDSNDQDVASDHQDLDDWKPPELAPDSVPTPPEMNVDDDHFDWKYYNRALPMTEIERCDVNDPETAAKVRTARLAGIPVVLTGHVGFCQFAAPWLVPKTPEGYGEKYSKEATENQELSTHEPRECTDVLDSGEDVHEVDTSGPILRDSSQNPSFVDTDNTYQDDTMHVGALKDNVANTCNDDATVPNKYSPVSCSDENSSSDRREDKVLECSIDSYHDNKVVDNHWLDLSLPHIVHTPSMIHDIGDEQVPILRKRYDETNPIRQTLSVRRFLKLCWPQNEEHDDLQDRDGKSRAPPQPLYLHQWLFTASDTAVPKLCGSDKSAPLPNDILGEDLLRYWYNEERCKGSSPYQYLFMGNTGTMSKLHKDAGGLAILIAPIVGTKEVVLVHRDDGADPMYDLNEMPASPGSNKAKRKSSIEKPDFDLYPMLASARVWRSTILPGEILIMPQGTYHQCRNLSPCLSYHCFHLDTLNLRAFFESWRDKDAREIEHDDVIWNASSELCSRVDTFVKELRLQTTRYAEIPNDIFSAVDSLRSLDSIVRQMVLQFELKADHDCTTNWIKLARDIEGSLHDFRYRRRTRIPGFRSRQDRKRKGPLLDSEKKNHQSEPNNLPKLKVLDALVHAPTFLPEETGITISNQVGLEVGESVTLELHGRQTCGTILMVRRDMRAAMIQFDDASENEDHFVPLEELQNVTDGGKFAAFPVAGTPVLEVGVANLYPGKVQFWCKSIFYLIGFAIDGVPFHRWMTEDAIVEQLKSLPKEAGLRNME